VVLGQILECQAPLHKRTEDFLATVLAWQLKGAIYMTGSS